MHPQVQTQGRGLVRPGTPCGVNQMGTKQLSGHRARRKATHLWPLSPRPQLLLEAPCRPQQKPTRGIPGRLRPRPPLWAEQKLTCCILAGLVAAAEDEPNEHAHERRGRHRRPHRHQNDCPQRQNWGRGLLWCACMEHDDTESRRGTPEKGAPAAPVALCHLQAALSDSPLAFFHQLVEECSISIKLPLAICNHYHPIRTKSVLSTGIEAGFGQWGTCGTPQDSHSPREPGTSISAPCLDAHRGQQPVPQP